MREIILYSAISLDDFIARSDGNIDWLNAPGMIPEGEDFGYGAFYKSIDTTLTGNATYKQVLSFGGPFPYPDKKNYVFTRQAGVESTDYVEFVNGNIARFCSELKRDSGKNIWLVGGGKVNSVLLDEGLIDKLILTKIPIPLGQGIPLFEQDDWKSKFKNSTSKVYKNRIVQIEMIKGD